MVSTLLLIYFLILYIFLILSQSSLDILVQAQHFQCTVSNLYFFSLLLLFISFLFALHALFHLFLIFSLNLCFSSSILFSFSCTSPYFSFSFSLIIYFFCSFSLQHSFHQHRLNLKVTNARWTDWYYYLYFSFFIIIFISHFLLIFNQFLYSLLQLIILTSFL